MANSMVNLTVISVTIFFFLVFRVAGDCTCSEEDIAGDPKSVTTPYKIGAFFAILIASAAGVAIPLMGKSVKALRAEGEMFFLIKAFAAGVILATGFVHILPDAFEQLTNPCLTNPVWENFPFTGFIAMVAAMLTLMVESTATGYYRRKHFKGESQAVGDEEHAGHVHIHGVGAMAAATEDKSKLELIRHRVTTQVLELGIVVHSVIIGIAVGASQSLDTVKTLMAALCFHQFFEGMGLGSCIHQAKFKWSALFTMALFFALTTPLGIAIGIGVTSTYKEDSPNALIVQGTLDSAAAGILIYMALVDLLAADFMNPKMQRSPRLMLGANLSLLLGAGCMSLIAKWA